jgi:S-formylglutathione hydrolase FrmB
VPRRSRVSLRRALGAALIACVAATAIVLARAHAAPRPRPAPVDLSFRSRALADRIGIRVYLPPDYRRSTRRYPVLYFLHGLPASPAAYRSLDFLRDALSRASRPAILVTVQGARESETDGEYLDSGPGHDWETAIAVELPRFVDGRFRTIARRRGRAILGVSAGGYGAMLVGLHHLDRFSAIESWSGYFHPTDPTGTQGLDLGAAAANARASAHTLVGMLTRRLARLPTFIGFYVGTEDGRFRPENERLDLELTAARVPHLFRLYAGAHAHGLWERHAPAWLRLALAHLAS